ncbi:MAG: arylsulfatase [Acidobacteria bacterium]|nr:arylsulfatase [Acidobacteriota bacterium]
MGWRHLYLSTLLLLALVPAGHPGVGHPGVDKSGASRAGRSPGNPPNIVLIYADDLGYGDLGSYGARGYQTPNLDRMAAEGIRLTSFYVATAVCSASRAALLTGAYPNRIGIRGALDHSARIGLSPDEETIAELLKRRGYATAIYGKWHLGHLPPFLPTRHGFDEYYGLPYSNDMWPNHPQSKNYYPELPLIEGEEVVRLNPDQSRLTTDYTTRAVSFIERNQQRPFFLYLPHTMPHVPLFVSERFRGKSEQGLYGDVIEELDWSVGEILKTIARLGLDRRTLVVFTSDNGPWLPYGNHAGSSGGLREGKGTAWEGGVRVPFIARWPGRIPAGLVSRAPLMTVDLLPTFARLAGTKPDGRRIIDGLESWAVLAGKGSRSSATRPRYFYWLDELHAVRRDRWKLHLPHPYRHLQTAGRDGKPGRDETHRTELALFDLDIDPAESNNVAASNPAVVKLLMADVEEARRDLGDSLTGRKGLNLRPVAKLQ